MQLLRIDHERHCVQDHPILAMLKRELPECPWMTYYHKVHDRWVVGCWANKLKGKVREYASWNDTDEPLTRSLVKKVLALAWAASTNPMRGDEVVRLYHESKAAELRENLDYQEEYFDVAKFTSKNAKGVSGERSVFKPG